MLIKSIEIKNFRRFESYRCEFDPRFTLLMGPNGSGKTSLLKAIFIGMSPWMQRFGQSSIGDEDLRRVNAIDPGGSSWRTPVFPSRVSLILEIDDQPYTVEIERDAQHTRVGGQNSTGWGMAFSAPSGIAETSATDQPLPLFARFGASNSVTGHGQPGAIQKPFESKDQIWQRAMNDVVDVTQLAHWFQYHELRTLQEGQAPTVYKVARTAALAAIHAEDIRYVVRDNQLMLLHADQGWRPFDQLSDGQRRIAAIVCELAMRCAALNSHLGAACIEQTPGIVTIDEIDLHLHPLWQRAIVADLCRVFPRLQFIAASHSPFLLQAVYDQGRVLDVSTGQFVEPTDRSIEDIAESVMGVEQPQRSQRFLELKQRAQEFYDLLEAKPSTEKEREELKLKLDEALAVFANDPASAAWLVQRRTAAGH